MNLLKKIGNSIKKKITPNENEANESSVDISNDVTTYIRCLFHDFRGPLNNISMAVDVLLGSVDKQSQDFDILKTIKDSCAFMSESLDGFLNLQNKSNSLELIELKYEPFHIVGLIKKIQYILLFNIMNKKIEIKYNIKPLCEWVIGDHKHIQHVLVNLLSNAVKFAKNNSKIMIKLEAKPIVNKKQPVTIYIIDENDWIPADIKSRLFKKYVTSDEDNGTGLGLYICKKIIELHGGTIIHENYRGRTGSDHEMCTTGTTGNLFKIDLEFEMCASGSDKQIKSTKNEQYVKISDRVIDTAIVSELKNPSSNREMMLQPRDTDKYDMLKFTESSNHLLLNAQISSDESLPKKNVTFLQTGNKIKRDSDSSMIRPAEAVSNTLPRPAIIKVFIIDDSNLSRKLMKCMFEQNCNNMKLYEAEDGLDAILKLNSKIQHISLILLDNIMPNITGVLLSKILRGIGYKGLIFGITGNGLDEDINEFTEAGANFVFTKPFNKQKFDKMMYFIQKNGYDTVLNGKVVENESGQLEWQIATV